MGLGAVLAQSQEEDDSVRPIAYASRSLQKHEKNYGVTELEGLGVVWAAKLFRPYLYAHHCTVYTDHEVAKLHFLGFSRSPASLILVSTLERLLLCSSSVRPNTNTSSK